MSPTAERVTERGSVVIAGLIVEYERPNDKWYEGIVRLCNADDVVFEFDLRDAVRLSEVLAHASRTM